MKKSYLVSGAGSGIGRAIAISLSKDGSKVFLLGRNKNSLEETKNLLTKGDHVILSVDTRDAKALSQAFKEHGLEQSDLAGVIVNAGVGGPNIYGPGDRWDEIISTNLTGAYVLANEALPALKKSRAEFKHLIFISSVLGKMGAPALTAYCAAKAGLLSLTRVLAIDWAQYNILVNSLCPGWVDTQMAREGIEFIAKVTQKSFEEAYREEMNVQPLKKWSEPDEVAAFVDYLVSERQRSITGQALDINNGSFMPQ